MILGTRSLSFIAQPKESKDIRAFVQLVRREDAKSIKVKENEDCTKFKLRLSKYLYTLAVRDAAKAAQLAKTLPGGMQAVVRRVGSGSTHPRAAALLGFHRSLP